MTLSLSQRESLDQAVTTYAAQLAESPLAQAYLAGRGFTPASAAMFRLGYVAAPLVSHEQYRGRLVIPYLTPTGVIDIRFRSIGDDVPKYMSRTGSQGHLYNVGAFGIDSGFIAVCEGEIDTMTAAGMCDIPCVGLPGANSWKPWMARAFTDYSKVFVLCDGDDAGRELGKKIRQGVDEAVLIHLPDGQDVNSLYLTGGASEIRARIGLGREIE